MRPEHQRPDITPWRKMPSVTGDAGSERERCPPIASLLMNRRLRRRRCRVIVHTTMPMMNITIRRDICLRLYVYDADGADTMKSHVGEDESAGERTVA